MNLTIEFCGCCALYLRYFLGGRAGRDGCRNHAQSTHASRAGRVVGLLPAPDMLYLYSLLFKGNHTAVVQRELTIVLTRPRPVPRQKWGSLDSPPSADTKCLSRFFLNIINQIFTPVIMQQPRVHPDG